MRVNIRLTGCAKRSRPVRDGSLFVNANPALRTELFSMVPPGRLLSVYSSAFVDVHGLYPWCWILTLLALKGRSVILAQLLRHDIRQRQRLQINLGVPIEMVQLRLNHSDSIRQQFVC
jgi:hypothetical protein